jgi:hypothetical protein
MKQSTIYGSEWLCATICSSLRHGVKMTRSLCRAYLMLRPQDTCAYSGNDWRSSWEGQHRMQGPLGQTFNDINGNSYGRAKTYMGRGSQDGSFVPGSVENTSPPHFADGRRRYPNAPCPCTESEEGASISEEYYTRIPQHGGLEAHPYRGTAGRHRRLVHFPRLYSMTRATDN